MKHFYVGTKNRIIYVLEIYDDLASAKKERENIKNRFPEYNNISLRRGKFYYDLGVFGKIHNKTGFVRAIRNLAHAHINLVNKDSEEFLINIRVRKIYLNKKETQTELF